MAAAKLPIWMPVFVYWIFAFRLPLVRQTVVTGTKRFDSDKSGDREVQRTMLELLNQMDGFSSFTEIKVL